MATIQQGMEGDLCYCSFDGEEAVSLISKSSAGIILCKTNLEAFIDGCSSMTDAKLLHPSQQLIFVDNPRGAFIKIINKIYNKDKKNVGVSPTAIISAQLVLVLIVILETMPLLVRNVR